MVKVNNLEHGFLESRINLEASRISLGVGWGPDYRGFF